MRRSSALIGSKSGLVGLVISFLFVLCAVLAPLLAPQSPTEQDLGLPLVPPGSRQHLLGTDELGRDTLSRIVYGSRVSLLVGAAAVGLGLLVGVPAGLLSGYFGGKVDSVLMRVADVLLAFPRIILAIAIMAVYGIRYWNLVVAIGFPDIPIFARMTRASTLTTVQLDYVTAARAVGSSHARILVRHIFPGVIGSMLVQSTFSMASAILTAGGLSFLGLGVQPPTPEWGSMLAQAQSYLRVAPHLALYPGVALALVVLGVNLLGDALRQVLDPRFTRRDN